ncbi:MAG: DUF4131 domain-containing protein [Cyanobacteria bacterium RI_101]|nr:DUF4131 domain-containing protein [Cyanobacteria bacterium RI_101]
MNRNPGLVACLAYILGLLSSLPLGPEPGALDWGLLTLVWLGLTVLTAFLAPRLWIRGPEAKTWLLMGFIALGAAFYCHWRIPQPSAQDISRSLKPPLYLPQTVAVTGELLNPGQDNGRGGRNFFLQASLVQKQPDPQFRPVQGQLYLSLKSAPSSLGACQKIRVTGELYRPRAPKNPGGFNFAAYLANQGIFSGLRATEGEVIGRGNCAFADLRRRIVDVQGAWLKPENGAGLLISSIVLGQKAVSLPLPLRRLFGQVGLSHLLAASGYQVSLLAGSVLGFSAALVAPLRLVLGWGTILLYLGLTGLQPSVLRASLMWGGIVAATVYQQKIRALGALLLVATLLLLIQPRWIGDLGFQLSFLATWGILVSTPYFQEKLDFLPPKIGEMIAVPLAATLWTTPLLLGQFSQLLWAALPLNILATPLVELLSLGGMVSAVLAVIAPPLGSGLTWLLAWPAQGLIWLAGLFKNLPALATGQTAPWQLVLVYSLFILVWLRPNLRPWRGWLVTLGLILLLVPSAVQSLTQTEAVLFHAPQTPAVLIRQPGRVTLIQTPGAGEGLIKPYLAQKGVNRIDCALTWSATPALKPNCPTLEPLPFQPGLWELRFGKQRWWLAQTARFEPLPAIPPAQLPTALVWAGKYAPLAWLDQLRPPAAIALAPYLPQGIQRKITALGSELWITGIDGAVLWTPQQGFRPALEETDLR